MFSFPLRERNFKFYIGVNFDNHLKYQNFANILDSVFTWLNSVYLSGFSCHFRKYVNHNARDLLSANFIGRCLLDLQLIH